MNDFTKVLNNQSYKKKTNINPLAQALAEKEQHYTQTPQNNFEQTNILKNQSIFDREQEQEKAKKEKLIRILHEQINPVDQTQIFDAKEKRVKEEINQIRQELKLLAKDVVKFHKEVEITLMTEIVKPGGEGQYYRSFFQRLRHFIMLLRQKIRSARTWAKQMQYKANKKKQNRKISTGVDFSRADAYGESKAVYETIHHERNQSYSGG